MISKLWLVLVLFVIPVHAQDKTQPKQDKARKVFKSTETHQFSGSRLKGQIKKPEISYIYQRKGLRAEQIINIPTDFDEEIVRDADKF